MDSLHPVLREYGFVAGTGPVKAFNIEVTKALRLNLPSLTVIGGSGAGKTTVIYDLFHAFASGKKVVPWFASAVGIASRNDNPKFFRTFEQAFVPSRSIRRLPVISDQEHAVNSVLVSCDEVGAERAVIFLDEAEELVHATLIELKAMTLRLSKHKIQTLLLLAAEPGILETPSKLEGKSQKGSLIRRFFSNTFHLRGLDAGDLGVMLAHLDVATWPEVTGPKYTEYFVPQLFKDGWRMKEQAALLWSEFQQTAAKLQLGEGTLILPCYVVLAIRYLLTELSEKPARCNAMPLLMREAVEASGFAAARQIETAEPPGGKQRSRASGRRGAAS